MTEPSALPRGSEIELLQPDTDAARRAALSLGADEADRYRRDGFFVRGPQFTPAELDGLRGAVEIAADRARARCANGRSYSLDGRRFVDLDRELGHVTVQFEYGARSADVSTRGERVSASSEDLKVIEPVHELHPLLDALLDDPRLAEPMRGLLGTRDIALWTDKLNLKRPRAGSGFGWHQDSPYWIHDCGHVDALPNVMVALDDATAANGCLRVIRGSHGAGCLPGTRDGSQLGGFYTDPACFDLAAAVAVEVGAGSLIFFSPHIVHGSLANRSDAPRRALVITCQPAGYPTLKARTHRPIA